MKKLVGLAGAVLVLSASVAYAGGAPVPPGPAPNAGNGVSDGSGFVSQVPAGPSGAGARTEPQSVGPAPNSGDGIPDASGFEDEPLLP